MATTTNAIINIAGKDVKIMSYGELQTQNPNGTSFSKDQYYSMLLNNLGYTKRPSNTSNWRDGIVIDSLIMDTDLNIPSTIKEGKSFLVIRKGMSLMNIFRTIKTWCKGETESGTVLDIKESFQLPDKMDIEHYIQNNLAIKRTKKTMANPPKWYKCDVEMRRAHNLAINDDYFKKCIKNFLEVCNSIIVTNHCSLIFTLGLINPDLLSSIIRNSEIKATNTVMRKNPLLKKYPALIKDSQIVKEFVRIFFDTISHYANKLKSGGFTALIATTKKNTSDMADNIKVGMETDDDEENDSVAIPFKFPLKETTVEDIKEKIRATKITDGIKKDIFEYVSEKSIPKALTELTNVKDLKNNKGKKYSGEYYQFLRVLYNIVGQIKIKLPTFLNTKVKLEIATGCYRDPYSFALYSKINKGFFMLDPDTMNIELLTAEEIINRYKELYGEELQLDPSMVNDEAVEPSVEVDDPSGDTNEAIQTESSNEGVANTQAS